MKIKLLDTTLRDGGYLNNWEFGLSCISDIESNLKEANIEYIEAGFLTSVNKHIKGNTLYNFEDNIQNKILMINLGEYNLESLSGFNHVRIAFKKKDLSGLKKKLSVLAKKNISFSLNPMHISFYTDDDFKILAEIVNFTHPDCITAVDTMGVMNESDTEYIFSRLDRLINRDICLGFHSHDNLALAYDNTLKLLNMNLDRTIIIDSCLDGIGRGGGMLSTNIIAMYLNDAYNKQYNIDLLNKLSDKYIHYLNNYDHYPYYLTALYKCHPNYGRFLSDKKLSYCDISAILELIPANNKMIYNQKLAENLYKENFLTVKEV